MRKYCMKYLIKIGMYQYLKMSILYSLHGSDILRRIQTENFAKEKPNDSFVQLILWRLLGD